MGFTVYPSYEAGASCASVSVPVFGFMECLSVAMCCLSFLGLGVVVWEFVCVVFLVDLGGRVLFWALGVCLFLCLGGLRVRLWGL